MRFMTEEEYEKSLEKFEKTRKRDAIFEAIGICLRRIFFTPLSIFFHVIAFVTKGVGYVASFGMFVGVYNLYKAIKAIMGGAPIGEVSELPSGIALILLPFVVFAISVITERLYIYLEDHAS